jgi:hypothetical protein
MPTEVTACTTKYIPKRYYWLVRELVLNSVTCIAFVREWHEHYCTAHRVLPNATQTSSGGNLNAQATSFRYKDSSNRDSFAVIKHQCNTSPATPYCLETIVK